MTQTDKVSRHIQSGQAVATATSFGRHREDDRSTRRLPSPNHRYRKAMAKRLGAAAIPPPGILAEIMAPADYSHSSSTSGLHGNGTLGFQCTVHHLLSFVQDGIQVRLPFEAPA